MESQLQGPRGHTFEDPQAQNAGLHSVIEDEGEPHREKKSVLKKVKDKAKKIKGTLKKQGQGDEHEHDQEHDYNSGDHGEDDEEEDEDEGMVEDPEIHGAPVRESAATGSVVAGQGLNLEKPLAMEEDRDQAKRSDEVAARPRAQGDQEVRIGAPEGLEIDPHAPKDWPGAIPPLNYQTKVVDSTGKGEQADMTPLIRSFDKMGVSDQPVAKPEAEQGEKGCTGSHDQFAPQPNPTDEEFASKPFVLPVDQHNPSGSTPKFYDPSKPEELPRDVLPGKSAADQSGYIEKISTSTSLLADKAVSAKNVVASKLGYGGSGSPKIPEGPEMGERKEEAAKSALPTEYAHKVTATVTEKLAPVYEKVTDVGSSAISKVKGTRAGTEGEAERDEASVESSGKAADQGVSVKQYLAEKLKPSVDDKALSEVISDALHKKKEELGKTGESKRAGSVTDSGEVARQLGTGHDNRREGTDATAARGESPGKGVVDRIKTAVTSLVGKGSDQQDNSQGSTTPSYVIDGGSGAGEVGDAGNVTREKKLQ